MGRDLDASYVYFYVAVVTLLVIGFNWMLKRGN